ncbi:hypothetical protein CFH99_07780 [Nocardioides aromaticivorans]|uniref:Uncharacterized protein n=1 Tax=Nocardioides aromaticivorans TaxID=200618 RepID=A0ABX7PID7_9ACTN|nr:hypothetical protein [Nocardioides aromaticivorans]QSR25522.1 hypothetical protein CFH99_07780 [Nocardioides aromaticivorans]
MPKNATPDEFGRLRVRDEDTGHELSINAPSLPHGNYTVLDERASDPISGEALPAVHGTPKSPVETTTNSGRQAENKEKQNG